MLMMVIRAYSSAALRLLFVVSSSGDLLHWPGIPSYLSTSMASLLVNKYFPWAVYTERLSLRVSGSSRPDGESLI